MCVATITYLDGQGVTAQATAFKITGLGQESVLLLKVSAARPGSADKRTMPEPAFSIQTWERGF